MSFLVSALTLVLVRTDLGREIVARMIETGAIISRPADSDEKAMKLLRTLSIVSRRRWPDSAEASVKAGCPCCLSSLYLAAFTRVSASAPFV